ncbi:MAG: gamma-glutamyltranspeptidase/glutathione hydrolase [Planctomycetota bacterium]|jgi:gamma-glutamyltranspeptidase/glutathione hydrolase
MAKSPLFNLFDRAQPLARCGLSLVFVGLLFGCRAADPFDQSDMSATPKRGAVVAEHPLAAQVGVTILNMGGNAADAAVATALALAVVYPQAGNLGGGGFALWVPHEGEPWSLDFRETTPSGYATDLYLDEAGDVVSERSMSTPLGVGIPGTPQGLFELYKTHGSKGLTFAALCAPAIALAHEGFEVNSWLASDLRKQSARKRLMADPAARSLFYPGGEALAEGEILVQPALARTLERYARGGQAAFYNGPTAEALVQTLIEADKRLGGLVGDRHMTVADLANYRVKVRKPLVGWFRGHQIISMGPPSSGGLALLQVLAILDGFPLDDDRNKVRRDQEMGVEVAAEECGLSARSAHWLVEAMRRAFADRAQHLGDPDFVDVPVDKLLAPEWIADRRISIGERSNPGIQAWQSAAPKESFQTTHLSVVDKQGNAVSMTTTLNTSFGSGIMVGEAGFLLNNELDDFSLAPGVPNTYGLIGAEANRLLPGKRPLSSMTPTVIREGGGGVSLVIGSPGGPRIITSVIQVILRVLVYEQSLEAAVAAPRLHQQWKPEWTRMEGGWPASVLESLENQHGQELRVEPGSSFGSVQAILIPDTRVPQAISDPRRGGHAAVQD